MPEFVLLLGLLIVVVSLYLMVRLESMGGLLDKVFSGNWLYAAALLRLLLGAGLIASAHTVRCPGAVALFGWLFVLGGLTLVVVPRPTLLRMTGWFSSMSATAARLWLGAALAFGLFFIFAYLG